MRRPIAFSSSTSCEACQKKRYGEIVVPRIATSVAQPARPARKGRDEGVARDLPPVRPDVDRRDDVGEEHEREPLQDRGDLVVAESDDGPRDPDAEEHDEDSAS